MEYTHISSDGMLWRFDGNRPVSRLADEVMKEVEEEMKTEKLKAEGGDN